MGELDDVRGQDRLGDAPAQLHLDLVRREFAAWPWRRFPHRVVVREALTLAVAWVRFPADADVPGRVRERHGGRRTGHQAIDVRGVRGVPAQEAVVVQDPQLTRLHVHSGVVHIRHVIGVGLAPRVVGATAASIAARSSESTLTSESSARSFLSSVPAIAARGSSEARTNASSSSSRSTYRTGTDGAPCLMASATRR